MAGLHQLKSGVEEWRVGIDVPSSQVRGANARQAG